jgi:hypothetical protein
MTDDRGRMTDRGLTTCHRSSVIFRSSVIRHPSSIICHPSSIIHPIVKNRVQILLIQLSGFIFFALEILNPMQLMMYIGNDLIESVQLTHDQISQPGYLGKFKRQLKLRYAELIQQTPQPPEFYVVDIALRDHQTFSSRYLRPMKAASSSEIKQELKQRSPAELIELCLRLARFKKENKELLTYLLFEAEDRDSYIKSVRDEIDEGFAGVNTSSIYYSKKTLRKILRIAQKFVRYSGDPVVEAEVLLHYAHQLNSLDLRWKHSTLLMNLYKGVLKKAGAAIETLHEDLQYDYLKRLEKFKI